MAKTAGETLPQEQRRWQQIQQTYPSQSEVVHQFPDGWTIQKPRTFGDVDNIGNFMRNCWRANWDDNYRYPDGPHTPIAPTSPHGPHYQYHALHDPQGMPRNAFFVRTMPYMNQQHWNPTIGSSYGMRNDPITPEHVSYLTQWAQPKGVEYPRAWDVMMQSEGDSRQAAETGGSSWTVIDGPNDPIMKAVPQGHPQWEYMTGDAVRVDHCQHGEPKDECPFCNHSAASDASDDELHIALELPEHIADKIEAWTKKQEWSEGTELEPKSEYHITLLYSSDGHEEHADADWLRHSDGYSVNITGVDEFGEGDEKATVLRLDAPEVLQHANDLLDMAESRELGVSRFPGGYKPHITVAYGPGKPAYIRAPKLKFRTGPSSVSNPRTSMALTPEHVRDYNDIYGSYLYHGTPLQNDREDESYYNNIDERVRDIQQHGLEASDMYHHQPSVYLSPDPQMAEGFARQRCGPGAVFKVDINKLDPRLLETDEWQTPADMPGIEDYHGDPEWGEQPAHQQFLADPENTWSSLAGDWSSHGSGAVAYRGHIPPEAIEFSHHVGEGSPRNHLDDDSGQKFTSHDLDGQQARDPDMQIASHIYTRPEIVTDRDISKQSITVDNESNQSDQKIDYRQSQEHRGQSGRPDWRVIGQAQINGQRPQEHNLETKQLDLGQQHAAKIAGPPTDPPNYHIATKDDKGSCGGCKMFTKGKCWGYGMKPVEPEGVCDSFEPETRSQYNKRVSQGGPTQRYEPYESAATQNSIRLSSQVQTSPSESQRAQAISGVEAGIERQAKAGHRDHEQQQLQEGAWWFEQDRRVEQPAGDGASDKHVHKGDGEPHRRQSSELVRAAGFFDRFRDPVKQVNKAIQDWDWGTFNPDKCQYCDQPTAYHWRHPGDWYDRYLCEHHNQVGLDEREWPGSRPEEQQYTISPYESDGLGSRPIKWSAHMDAYEKFQPFTAGAVVPAWEYTQDPSTCQHELTSGHLRLDPATNSYVNQEVCDACGTTLREWPGEPYQTNPVYPAEQRAAKLAEQMSPELLMAAWDAYQRDGDQAQHVMNTVPGTTPEQANAALMAANHYLLNREASASEHSLYFQPNPSSQEWGRGFIHVPTQTVHTWPEEEGSHVQMARAKGYPSVLETEPFAISPRGTVHAAGGFNLAKYADLIRDATGFELGPNQNRLVDEGADLPQWKGPKTSAQNVMYHISPQRNRESIMTNGLQLSDTPSKYVWLFSDPQYAQEMVQRSWGGDTSSDLWQVNTDGLQLEPDPHPGLDVLGKDWQEIAWVSAQPIGPERVQLVNHISRVSRGVNRPTHPSTQTPLPTRVAQSDQIVKPFKSERGVSLRNSPNVKRPISPSSMTLHADHTGHFSVLSSVEVVNSPEDNEHKDNQQSDTHQTNSQFIHHQSSVTPHRDSVEPILYPGPPVPDDTHSSTWSDSERRRTLEVYGTDWEKLDTLSPAAQRSISNGSPSDGTGGRDSSWVPITSAAVPEGDPPENGLEWLPWEPGTSGKGGIYNGQVYAWKTWDPKGQGYRSTGTIWDSAASLSGSHGYGDISGRRVLDQLPGRVCTLAKGHEGRDLGEGHTADD